MDTLVGPVVDSSVEKRKQGLGIFPFYVKDKGVSMKVLRRDSRI